MIKLNKDQEKLIDELREFMRSNRKHFVLAGQAGVGKTTCIRYFLEKIRDQYNVVVTTPTNKSLKVIKNSIGTTFGNVAFATIYSLLGLKLQPNGSVKEIADMGKDDAGEFDLIIVDEGSMLAKIVMMYMDRKIGMSNTKVLMIGDKEQFPPVGEDVSPIWQRYKIDFELTKVERHQNSILEYVQHIRDNPKPKFESTGDQVFIHDEDSFLEEIVEQAKTGVFHRGEAKVVAWRNKTVDFYNEIIRANYEPTESDEPFVENDRIVVMEPIPSDIPNSPNLASTDDEAVVLGVTEKRHPKYPQFKILAVDLLTELGDTIVARVIHPDSAYDLEEQLNLLAEQKKWGLFWTMKDSFHKIKHAYAITGHRAQGSTFPYVYVDAADIWANRDLNTRTKSYYVTCSRTSEGLNILPPPM